MKLRFFFLLPVLLSMIVSQSALSCPVCFGDKNSSMTAGMNSAILVMLGITGVVLGLIGTFFLMMLRRFKRYQKEISEATYIDEFGALQIRNEKGVQEWNNI